MAGRVVFSGRQKFRLILAGLAVLALLLWLGGRASSYPLQGVDVSAKLGKIDWAKVKADGANFAYILATSGETDPDPAFEDNWKESAAAGLRRGAIHRYDLCRLAHDQATSFIATVPREIAELPVVISLDVDGKCKLPPGRDVVVQEVASLVKAIEAHSEKSVILRISRAFETEFALSRAINRPLWLDSFFLTPSYGERAWIMWEANGSRSVDGISQPVPWSVLRP
jgi:lysozyme